MAIPKGQYRFRRISGVSDLMLRDDKKLRKELMRFKHIRPMLEEDIGEPSFETLKSIPEFEDLQRKTKGEVILLVSSKAGQKIEKSVAILGSEGRLFAICTWEWVSGDITFRVIN